MELLYDLEQDCFGEAFGIVEQWCTCTGWCWEKTEIIELDREIAVLYKVDLSRLDDKRYHHILVERRREIENVLSQMLELFL